MYALLHSSSNVQFLFSTLVYFFIFLDILILYRYVYWLSSKCSVKSSALYSFGRPFKWKWINKAACQQLQRLHRYVWWYKAIHSTPSIPKKPYHHLQLEKAQQLPPPSLRPAGFFLQMAYPHSPGSRSYRNCLGCLGLRQDTCSDKPQWCLRLRT